MPTASLWRRISPPALVLVILFAANAAIAGVALARAVRTALADKEARRPANVQVTAITVDECTDCYDLLTEAYAALSGAPLTMEKKPDVPYPSDAARALIEKYGIERLPALVITGETEKENVNRLLYANADLRNDALVWSPPQPVYVDPATGEPVGRVDVTVIRDPRCTECADPGNLTDQLAAMGLRMNASSTLDWRSDEARALIARYDLTSVPSVILSKEAGLYPTIATAWRGFGTSTPDGLLVASLKIPPYVEIPSGELRGRVDLTMVTDASCTTCYDVTRNGQILRQGYGVALARESSIDVSSAEGKALVAKYKITQVPTMILTGDVDAYANLAQIWPTVGSVEADGAYVFRNDASMGPYKDLTTGTVVTPTAQAPTAGPAPAASDDMASHHG